MRYRECQIISFRFACLSLVLCLGIFLTACGHSTAKFLAKGEEYLQKRKFHDAMMQFRSAAESDTTSAKAHWGLARSYENLGKFNEVLDELRKTVDLDDKNLEAKTKLGTYFLLLQPPLIAEATKLRDDTLAADPDFIEAHILTASILAARGKPDADVVVAVNKAIALDPKRVESYISLERLYTTREKSPEAEAAIKRGIEANPTSVLGHTEYGKFLTYASRDADAETQFNKAIEIDANSIEAREAIAEFFVTSNQYEKAEAAYKGLVQMQENSPESKLELAEFYSKTGRKEDAIAVLDQILVDSPNYVLARYRLGQIYLERHDEAKVYEQLDALLKLNDADTEALMLRVRAKMQEGKADEAVKDLEEILKKQPSNRDALFLMAQAQLVLDKNDQALAFIADLDRFHPAFLKTSLLKIQAAFAVGEPQNALKLSNELIERSNSALPNSEITSQSIQELRVRALSSRGLAYLDLGKLSEATADLHEVVRLSPKSSGAMVNLAKALVVNGNAAGGLDLYEKALATDPQNFDAVSGIVSTSIDLNQTARAHQRLDVIANANGGRSDVLAALRYLKATIYTAEKNTPAAEKELLNAIALDGSYLQAYSAYASLLATQNRTDEAIDQYKKVIAKKPAAPLYTMLGILEDGAGNMVEAEQHYRKALDMTPEAPIAANNLAWLIVDNQGNLDEALRLATSAVARNQTVPGFYDTLGWIYLKKGLAAPAVEQLKKAVALEEANAKKNGTAPNPGYRMRLGIAFAKAGDKVSARREVESSLKNMGELSQREVTEAKSVLASL